MTDDRDGSVLVRQRAWVIVAVGLVAYVAFLGAHTLWYPDEPDIGEVCRAMYVGGDWIVPRRNGDPWVDYWPGLYWAGTAASLALGAMTEFSLRLPSAAAGIGLALWTCAFASRRFDARTGLWAGLLLATFGQFAYNAVSYRPDVLFSLCAGGGVLLYASGSGEVQRLWPRIGGFVLFGLAVLVKGPLGLLLPGFVLTLWHLSRREWVRLFTMAPLTLVAIAVALPWALLCAHGTSAEWFWGEIYAQNFMRFDEGGRGHVKPWHYYLTRIWADLAPWSPLLPFALVWLWRSPLRRDRFAQLALWWFGAMLAFLTWAATKRQLYLLPAYPAIAIIVAAYVARLGRDGGPDPRPARATIAALCAALTVAGVAGVAGAGAFDPIVARLGSDPLVLETARALRWPALGCGAAFVVLAGWTFTGLRRRGLQAALGRTAAATAVVYALAAGLLAPAAEPLKTYAPACAWIRAEIGAEDRFGLLFPDLAHHKMGAFGYYTGATIVLLDDEAALERFFAAHPTSVALVHEDSAERLFASPNRDWRGRVARELIAGRYRYFVLRGRN